MKLPRLFPHIPAQCDRPILTDNTVVFKPDQVTYDVGTVITFSCRNGDDVYGPTSSSCQKDRTWDLTSDPLCTCKFYWSRLWNNLKESIKIYPSLHKSIHTITIYFDSEVMEYRHNHIMYVVMLGRLNHLLVYCKWTCYTGIFKLCTYMVLSRTPGYQLFNLQDRQPMMSLTAMTGCTGHYSERLWLYSCKVVHNNGLYSSS